MEIKVYENNNLKEYKASIEKKEKQALIESFYMLSDEDKAEVVENKAKYSLEDIEAKLSIICVRKKVNFDSEDSAENKNNTEEEKSPLNIRVEKLGCLPQFSYLNSENNRIQYVYNYHRAYNSNSINILSQIKRKRNMHNQS